MADGDDHEENENKQHDESNIPQLENLEVEELDDPEAIAQEYLEVDNQLNQLDTCLDSLETRNDDLLEKLKAFLQNGLSVPQPSSTDSTEPGERETDTDDRPSARVTEGAHSNDLDKLNGIRHEGPTDPQCSATDSTEPAGEGDNDTDHGDSARAQDGQSGSDDLLEKLKVLLKEGPSDSQPLHLESTGQETNENQRYDEPNMAQLENLGLEELEDPEVIEREYLELDSQLNQLDACMDSLEARNDVLTTKLKAFLQNGSSVPQPSSTDSTEPDTDGNSARRGSPQ